MKIEIIQRFKNQQIVKSMVITIFYFMRLLLTISYFDVIEVSFILSLIFFSWITLCTWFLVVRDTWEVKYIACAVA